jgi:hypothetical protein
MAAPSRIATLEELSKNSEFVLACKTVQDLRSKSTTVRQRIKDLVGTFDLATADLTDCVTANETPFEAKLRAKMKDAPDFKFAAGAKAIADAHDAGVGLKTFFQLFETTKDLSLDVMSNDLETYPNTPVGTYNLVYVLLSYLKYRVYGQRNAVAQMHIQRVNTFLFCYFLSLVFTFTRGGAEVPLPATDVALEEASPLKDLLDAAKTYTDHKSNVVLNRVLDMDPAGAAEKSSKLSRAVQSAQTSLNRAMVGIKDARAQKGDEVTQTIGFLALTAVCVSVFYGWMKYRPALWARMRVPMATTALVTSIVVLTVTGLSIARPVEKFETHMEEFCASVGNCEGPLTAWALEASKQANVTALDATASLSKNLMDARQEALAEDLAAVSQRMHATDLEYRDAVFTFNRVRQAKRFVVMTLAIALLLMVLLMMGMPARVVVGMHVAAAVAILVVAVLVYRGNAQRFRANWNQIYFPGPDSA